MKWTNRLQKWLTVGGAWSATALTLGMTVTACLSRPVGKQPPTTKVNFTSTVSQQAVDKVDLLFAIDNSASMGDKQAILAEAVPNLIEGLLQPKCLGPDGNPVAGVADPSKPKDQGYGCGPGNQPEFKPVSDMHIGIISSSLGNFGGDVCPLDTNPRANDRSHLISIAKGGTAVPKATPLNFLTWFPQSEDNTSSPDRHPAPANPIITIKDLEDSFAAIVTGVDQTGCGLEAQLESVYRFLNQPDPWDTIRLAGKFADIQGVDDVVLQQRADFLRPDSLVAIIMLTDEDDSSADPYSLGGQGWAFMAKNFPGSHVARNKGGTTAPRGTKICETNPGSEDCRSCGFQEQCDGQPWCAALRADPNCKTSGLSGQQGAGYDGFYGPGDDELNVRFFRMKQRFGIDPQYPMQRYIDGLTKARVPDRAHEHVITTDGKGNRAIADYTGVANCTNPLFAARLPRSSAEDTCNLPRGTRSPDLVFFAIVGGVPNELLYPGGYQPTNPEANRTTNEKWNSILGRDSIHYDYSGIDAHMIQSTDPRPPLTGDTLPRGNNGQDAINGREWNTLKGDLQYACTFPLGTGQTRTCAPGDQSCDCAPPDTGQTETNPPLCSDQNHNLQIRAKAYPTVRELELARSLGDQGIAASLCPIQLTNKDAPDYGYKPAVAAIIDRLKNALTTQCLPQKLQPVDGQAPCLVLAQLGDESQTCSKFGLKTPPEFIPGGQGQAILDVFLEQQRAESGNVGDAGLDLSRLPVCVLDQANVKTGDTCKDDTRREWCYVENDNANHKTPAGRCPQALIFSTGTSDMSGARFSLQCIQNLKEGVAAGQPEP